MTVRIGAGVSTEPDPLAAGVEAARVAGSALRGAAADLVLVFASGAHLAAPEATLEGVHSALAPRALVGCGAAGVLGARRELESGTALAVWAASFGGAGEATTWHATASDEDGEAGSERLRPLEGGIPALEGLPALDAATGAIVLSDPYSFPTEVGLAELAAQAPTVSVLGGVSSARTQNGGAAMFFGEEVREQGAVGVVLRGIEMLPCVSQGAAPLGRELTITSAEGNVIHELAGRPALEALERTIGELSARERVLVTAGLLIGIVIDGGKPEYEQGDFLVRGILGADRESGSLAVAAAVREGQVVRWHARDRFSADEDLRRALRLRVQALGGGSTAGALLFSCNGRGRAMFGAPDHDATAVQDELGGAPTAGFFAAGEIGPVGGRSFLHGFTATVAVFAE